MKVIANTNTGVIIEATQEEARDLLSSITGKRPSEVPIGTTIPVLDYTGLVSNIRSLKDNYYIKEINKDLESLNQAVKKINSSADLASKIEF